MFLIFDTQTTGIPNSYKAPVTDSDNWPRMVQLAWQLYDNYGNLLQAKNFIVKPRGYDIPIGMSKIHGITTERAKSYGHDLLFVLEELKAALVLTDYIVGHNNDFNVNIVGAEFFRIDNHINEKFSALATIDTMKSSVYFCEILGGRVGGFKYPSLTDLHYKLFNENFGKVNDAASVVSATVRCFFGLVKYSVIQPKEITDVAGFVFESPQLMNTKKEIKRIDAINEPPTDVDCSFSGIESTSCLIRKVMGQIENNNPDAMKLSGICSGFYQLDKMTSGLQQGELVYVASNSYIERYAYALSIVKNAAAYLNTPTAFFLFKTPSSKLMTHLFSSIVEIPFYVFQQKGELNSSDFRLIQSKVLPLVETPIFTSFSGDRLSIDELSKKAFFLKKKHGIKILIIDDIQNLTNNFKENDIREIYRSLKSIAIKLNVSVLLLDQLGESALFNNKEKCPETSDIKEFDLIEDYIDSIHFIHNPHTDTINDDIAIDGIRNIFLAKNSRGTVGNVQLKFAPDFMQFQNL